MRAISESLSNVTAFGFAIDAGVQYVTGPNDNFKFGISLRNVGTPMTYRARSGRQFIVMATGSGANASLVAWVLPRAD